MVALGTTCNTKLPSKPGNDQCDVMDAAFRLVGSNEPNTCFTVPEDHTQFCYKRECAAENMKKSTTMIPFALGVQDPHVDCTFLDL